MGKLFYQCLYDKANCYKKLDTVNKIAEHICKFHMGKVNVNKFLKTNNTQSDEDKQPFYLEDIFIVNIFYFYFHFSDIEYFIVIFKKCQQNDCVWAFQHEKGLKYHKLKHKNHCNLDEPINQEILSLLESEKNHPVSITQQFKLS